MTDIAKYKLSIAGTVILFLFLIGTEVRERVATCWVRYDELKTKELKALSPSDLAFKRTHLISEREGLKKLWQTNDRFHFDESPTGLFEYLNHCANRSGVRIALLTPSEISRVKDAQIHEQAFTIACESDYHSLGAFLASIESGQFPVRVRKLSVVRKDDGHGAKPLLTLEMEGSAEILAK